MRDAQHDVGLTDEPWPGAVIRELPVGLLEVDAGGRVVRANPELVRLLADADAGAGAGAGVGAGAGAGAGPGNVSSDWSGQVAGRPASECWPCLTEAMVAVLAGRTVDTLLRTAYADLRVCAVPRRLGSRPQGGLIVVSVVASDPAPVVDLREGHPAGMAARHVVGAAHGDAAEPVVETVRQVGPAWLRMASGMTAGGVRRRLPAVRGDADEHAATHDVLTGLPNQVLLLHCLADALASCGPDGRVGVLAAEATAEAGTDSPILREIAGRLTRLIGPGDTAARLEGGRFAVVLRDVRRGADVERFLERTNQQLRGSGPGTVDGLGMVLADPATGAAADRDPRLVLALALEAMERSRAARRPVLGTEAPAEAEQARLAALSEYDLYDVALDDALQGITQVALATCDALTSLLTFVDSNLQWVRAVSGGRDAAHVDGRAPRHLALCDRTIRGRDVLVVPDIENDPDFHRSRHVGWQVGMRFYAGAPLITGEGRAVGTLCVFDRRPRELTDRQRQSLRVLAAETVALLDAHRVWRAP